MESFLGSYGIEIVVSLIVGVLTTLFGRIIYFTFLKEQYKIKRMKNYSDFVYETLKKFYRCELKTWRKIFKYKY